MALLIYVAGFVVLTGGAKACMLDYFAKDLMIGSSPLPTAKAWLRCAARTAASTPTCRYATTCDTSERKLPATTAFATEAECKAFKTFTKCYDPMASESGTFSCVQDYLCGQTVATEVEIQTGFSYEGSCNSYEGSAWRRCIKADGSGAVCRPYEVNCLGGEIQTYNSSSLNKTIDKSPNSNMARTAAILASKYTNRQDCIDATPVFACFRQDPFAATKFSAADSQDWGWSCHLDTVLKCPNPEAVRMESYGLFATVEDCRSVQPMPWLKCRSERLSKGTCMPYDAITLSQCPAGYTQYGREKTFPYWLPCMNYEDASFQMCWDDNNQLAYCLQTDFLCYNSYSTPVGTGTYPSMEVCNNAVSQMMYYRCVSPVRTRDTVFTKCIPAVETLKTSKCPGGGDEEYTVSPSDTVFKSRLACQSSVAYQLCYNYGMNLLQCIPDTKLCSQQVAATGTTWSRAIAETFGSKQECLAKNADVYHRCIKVLSGRVTCRPIFNDGFVRSCGGTDVDEFTNPIAASYPDQYSCDQATPQYYYCYDSAKPTTPNCVLDKLGCSTKLMVRNSAGYPETFTTTSLCEDYTNTGLWTACILTSDGVTKTCRPYYAESESPLMPRKCKNDETEGRTFIGLSACTKS